MKMNFKVILCALIVIELVQLIDAKRSFGLTSRRSKSKSPSVRRGQHGHDGDDHVPIPKAPAAAPAPVNTQKNIGWNTQQAHNTHNAPSAPSGPITAGHVPQGGLYSSNTAHQPPPYGMNHGSPYGGAPPAYNPHHSPSGYGAPPAYNAHSNYGSPPAYSPGGFNQPKQAYGAPQMGASPYGQNNHYGNNQMMGGSPMMAGGMMGGNQMMGGGMVPMMGVMPMQQQSRGSGLGSGLMTNLFAGLAGYQIAKAFSGGSHGSNYNNQPQRERDIIIINNPPAQQITAADGTVVQPSAPISDAYPQTPLNPPPVSAVASVPGVPAIASDPAILSTPDESPKIPQDAIPEAAAASLPQLVPTNNEYNYWGLPQYGIPLYGYNLPSQITEYYQIDTIKLNHDSEQQQQQQQAEQTTTSSAATSS